MSIEFNGRLFAKKKLENISGLVGQAQAKGDFFRILSIYPHEDEASVLYTTLKKQDAAKVGIEYVTFPLSLKQSRHEWLRAVMNANQQDDIQAILVQKPSRVAYEKFNNSTMDFSVWWQNIAEAISIEKDIDGLAPMTLFKLEKAAQKALEEETFLENLDSFLLPATAQAVLDIALFALSGDVSQFRRKKVAVIGRSVIVGRPAAAGFRLLGFSTKLLSSQDKLATQLPEYDIIVTATGKSSLISSKWIKEGSILIDVGAPVPEFQPDCYSKAAFYTPVPFGVGPVTRACLLENVFKLSEA